MSTVDDYRKNGGMAGYAQRLLNDQLKQATEDEGHIFRGVVEAMQRGEHERASQLCFAILRDLPDGDPLGVLKVFFVTLPVTQLAIHEAADRIDDEPFQETLPLKIVQWGAIEAHARAVEPMIQSGKKHSAAQSEKARKKRPTKNETRETLDSVICTLSSHNPNEKPSVLWIHLKTAISEWAGSDCQEVINKEDHDKTYYQFQCNEKWSDITFGTFRKKLKNRNSGI